MSKSKTTARARPLIRLSCSGCGAVWMATVLEHCPRCSPDGRRLVPPSAAEMGLFDKVKERLP
jgi:hypothetical protein